MVALSLSSSSPSPFFGWSASVPAPASQQSPRPEASRPVAAHGDNVQEVGMPIRKSPLLDEQTVDPVEQASAWAVRMTQWEATGPGDLPRAMARLERRHGLPSNTFWSLRYRKPKDIFTKVYLKLAAAYEAERQRQLRLLQHEQSTAIAAGAPAAVVRAAADLAGAPVPNHR